MSISLYIHKQMYKSGFKHLFVNSSSLVISGPIPIYPRPPTTTHHSLLRVTSFWLFRDKYLVILLIICWTLEMVQFQESRYFSSWEECCILTDRQISGFPLRLISKLCSVESGAALCLDPSLASSQCKAAVFGKVPSRRRVKLCLPHRGQSKTSQDLTVLQ